MSLVPDQTSPTACFSVHAAAEPSVMARVLEHFAKRGLVPTRWHSVVTDKGALSIDVQMAGLDAQQHAFVARCLRQIPSVESVLTFTKPGEAAGHARVA